MATAGNDGAARLWNAEAGQRLLILKGHSQAVSSLTFSRDGSAFGNQDADGDLFNDVHASSSLANLTDAPATWATTNCIRLLVYLVGPSEMIGGSAHFHLSPTDALSSAALDAQLDALQNTWGVEDVVVMADFPCASDFLRGGQPPAGETWRWSGTTGGFGRAGTYTILCQAVYEDDRLSVPILARLIVGTQSQNWHLC